MTPPPFIPWKFIVSLLLAMTAAIHRPTPPIPEPQAKVEVEATPKPAPEPKRPGRRLTHGWATYYAGGSGHAAAGPALRKALGRGWRGTLVNVCRRGVCVPVRLTDWCACGDRHGEPTVIDLLRGDFETLGSLSSGVMKVTVTR